MNDLHTLASPTVISRLIRRSLVISALFVLGGGLLMALGAMTAAALGWAAVLLAGAVAWLFVAIHQDLALARREAGTHLRARLSRYLARPDRAYVIDGIMDPLLLIAPDKTIAEANAPARGLFSERMIGRSLALHVRHPKILETVEEAIEFHTTALFELALPANTEQHYRVTVARTRTEELDLPLLPANRHPFYVVVTLHNITQAKVSEKMRADFVANASHELRTPLSSLIGFIETLQNMARDDHAARDRFLTIMSREADRMVRLIDDLLSLSRIELDRHVQPNDRVAFQQLIEGLLPVCAVRAEKRGIRFDVRACADLPPIRGDRDQLAQVFLNLTTNSIKYGRPDSVITIAAEPVRRMPEIGEPGVRITVTDQGEGIAPDHLPRLTERFYRVDSARSRSMGGTGLGLAIVKHIVTRHRGHLAISSELGVGTQVAVYLPLFTGDQSRNSAPERAAKKAGAEAMALAKPSETMHGQDRPSVMSS